jgi:hypothetical protein
MRRSVRVQVCDFVATPKRWAIVRLVGPPADVSFEGRLRCRGVERPFYISARTGDSREVLVRLPPGRTEDRYELILRPSITAASQTVELTRIWNGDVSLENIAPVPTDRER